jgi:predicted peroxiredoxin
VEKKLLMIITHSSDAPERAAAALAVANTAVAEGRDLVIFALNEGALLVKRGFVDTITDQKAFPPIKDLLAGLIEAGQRFYVCSTCAAQFDIETSDLIPETVMAGPPVLLALTDEREVMNF